MDSTLKSLSAGLLGCETKKDRFSLLQRIPRQRQVFQHVSSYVRPYDLDFTKAAQEFLHLSSSSSRHPQSHLLLCIFRGFSSLRVAQRGSPSSGNVQLKVLRVPGMPRLLHALPLV